MWSLLVTVAAHGTSSLRKLSIPGEGWVPMNWGKGLDPGVFGRFDLAALAQPQLKFLFVCLFASTCMYKHCQMRYHPTRPLLDMPPLLCMKYCFVIASTG
jgi:hypothetical protein